MANISLKKQNMRHCLHKKRCKNQHFHELNNALLVRNISRFIYSIYDSNKIVACFWPLENEVDLRPLLDELYQNCYSVVLPETTKKGHSLIFRLWNPTIKMIKGRYQTFHPEGDRMDPDIILVPLLAFDRLGNRLGYGGGYYDRTFETMPKVNKIGVAFSYQEVQEVPTENFDCRLSTIITETEIIEIKKE